MAIRYLHAAGYDPMALLTYVEENLPPNPKYIVTTAAFGCIRNRFAVKLKRPALSEAPSLRKVQDSPPSQATTLR